MFLFNEFVSNFQGSPVSLRFTHSVEKQEVKTSALARTPRESYTTYVPHLALMGCLMVPTISTEEKPVI